MPESGSGNQQLSRHAPALHAQRLGIPAKPATFHSSPGDRTVTDLNAMRWVESVGRHQGQGLVDDLPRPLVVPFELTDGSGGFVDGGNRSIMGAAIDPYRKCRIRMTAGSWRVTA